MKKALLFVSCSLLAGASLAFEPKLDWGVHGSAMRLDSALNPGNFAAQPERQQTLAARMGAEFAGGEVLARFAVQRTHDGSGWHAHHTPQLLRAWRKWELGDSTTLTLGKKNLHLDSGFAFHPLDFFEDLAIIGDFDQWRSSEEGFVQASLSHATASGSIHAVYADDISMDADARQRNRGLRQALLSLHHFGDSWDGTLLLQKYHIGHVGWGAAFSHTATDALAVNASFFARRSSLRPFFGAPDSPLPRWGGSTGRWRAGENKWRARFLLGAQYTGDSGTHAMLEYFFDGEGFSRAEWRRFRQYVAHIPALPAGGARFGAYGNALNMLSMRRQHYLHARLKREQTRLKPEIGLLWGEDGGGQLNLKMQHKLDSGVLLWAHFSRNLGAARSEFALFPARASWHAGLRHSW